ncbi:MAG: N-6 DNA methylase, partial [Leptolyngbyaceae cyanobacterium]
MLFIDASGDDHFEKAKNQNHLRERDVDKIILTYRRRLVEDKYSYRAPRTEIEENDFNLNIPRYVDTFEEEEPIDSDAVVWECRASDRDLVATDQLILRYWDE